MKSAPVLPFSTRSTPNQDTSNKLSDGAVPRNFSRFDAIFRRLRMIDERLAIMEAKLSALRRDVDRVEKRQTRAGIHLLAPPNGLGGGLDFPRKSKENTDLPSPLLYPRSES